MQLHAVMRYRHFLMILRQLRAPHLNSITDSSPPRWTCYAAKTASSTWIRAGANEARYLCLIYAQRSVQSPGHLGGTRAFIAPRHAVIRAGPTPDAKFSDSPSRRRSHHIFTVKLLAQQDCSYGAVPGARMRFRTAVYGELPN
jgi:hypothetical protein